MKTPERPKYRTKVCARCGEMFEGSDLATECAHCAYSEKDDDAGAAQERERQEEATLASIRLATAERTRVLEEVEAKIDKEKAKPDTDDRQSPYFWSGIETVKSIIEELKGTQCAHCAYSEKEVKKCWWDPKEFCGGILWQTGCDKFRHHGPETYCPNCGGEVEIEKQEK